MAASQGELILIQDEGFHRFLELTSVPTPPRSTWKSSRMTKSANVLAACSELRSSEPQETRLASVRSNLRHTCQKWQCSRDGTLRWLIRARQFISIEWLQAGLESIKLTFLSSAKQSSFLPVFRPSILYLWLLGQLANQQVNYALRSYEPFLDTGWPDRFAYHPPPSGDHQVIFNTRLDRPSSQNVMIIVPSEHPAFTLRVLGKAPGVNYRGHLTSLDLGTEMLLRSRRKGEIQWMLGRRTRGVQAIRGQTKVALDFRIQGTLPSSMQAHDQSSKKEAANAVVCYRFRF